MQELYTHVGSCSTARTLLLLVPIFGRPHTNDRLPFFNLLLPPPLAAQSKEVIPMLMAFLVDPLMGLDVNSKVRFEIQIIIS